MMKGQIISLVLLIILTSCNPKVAPVATPAETQDDLLLSVLWYQKSGEMRALYYQCYRNAQESLLRNMKQHDGSKPFAVVLDIDETVLDNSPFEAWQILTNKGFSAEAWGRWVNMAAAKALPGAVAFTAFADSLGVEVFYISNRNSAALEPTIRNLRSEGFPCADTAHVLLMNGSSSKGPRREAVAEKYSIILLIGDNLADLNAVFEKRPDAPSFATVDEMRTLFGTEYIILPNPMYGTWLNAILKKGTGKNETEKLKSLLNSY